MWDPYSSAYVYPPAQPSARYYRQRAPVNDRYGFLRTPEDWTYPTTVKETPNTKTVRTIPVTDGSTVEAMTQKVVQSEIPSRVGKYENNTAAATKVQAVYRGYYVRKTEPLKHLKSIRKVKEELENFEIKFQGEQQRKMICNDPQERLKWTEGIMALLLRLDQLQGAHPDVRLIRKSVAKELIEFQEKLDSLTDASEDENVNDSPVDKENDKNLDFPNEESELIGNGEDALREKGVTEMEIDKIVPDGKSDMEKFDFVEAAMNEDVTHAISEPHQPVEYGAVIGAMNELREANSNSIEIVEDVVPDQQATDDLVTSVSTGHHVLDGLPTNSMGEVLDPIVSDDLSPRLRETSADASMDVEIEVVRKPVVDLAENVEAKSSPSKCEPPTNAEGGYRESCQLDNMEISESSRVRADESTAKESDAASLDVNEEVHVMEDNAGRGRAEEPPNVFFKPELDTLCCTGLGRDNLDVSSSLKEKGTNAGSVDPSNRCMIPAESSLLTPQATTLAAHCCKNLQKGQPQSSTVDDNEALSNHVLLQQLLDENRKLRDVVGRVLHWGKQQNDIINNLASRIEELEESQSQVNKLHCENQRGRKRINTDSCVTSDGKRVLRRIEKSRRKGKLANNLQLSHYDPSNWLSAESDEYF